MRRVSNRIAALKGKFLALYKTDADKAKRDAKEDKQDNPGFHPYSIDTVWRVTFESDAVPASVFAKYLAPPWKAVFSANH